MLHVLARYALLGVGWVGRVGGFCVKLFFFWWVKGEKQRDGCWTREGWLEEIVGTD